MASIIKHQLIKSLSKFTRNLKPEQISLDVLKGKTKLKYIEINEETLTELLELPSWLSIKKAYCTGVIVSVPWTSLKTNPIRIFIDEIQVEVQLAAGGNVPKGPTMKSNFDSTSYGFVNKVIEGMSLYINTVEINFDSDAFGGSFMLSRLSVESRTPAWMKAQDLRLTRISCPNTNRTLLFKQVSWQLLRIEASAKSERNEKRTTINAPLRLITSGGKIRIALKKNSTDGSVIHGSISMLMEDILWVATLPQLRSAIAFYNYIIGLVKQSATTVDIPLVPSKQSAPVVDDSNGLITSKFNKFDFDQTSYHLNVSKIDLHLCDDANANSGYPPEWNIDSGAMQVTLYHVWIDIYPKTLATSNRSTWLRYQSPNAFTQWNSTRLCEQMVDLIEASDESGKTRLTKCWPQLMSFNVVVRVFDLSVQCVSEVSTKKENLQKLFTTERQARQLPQDKYIIHFEFANFFHPHSSSLPVPSPASHLELGPFSLLFDSRTLRWCLYVAHNLSSVILNDDVGTPPIPHSDVKIEIIMPKIIIPLPDYSSDRRLPHRLVFSVSSITLCNCPSVNKTNNLFSMLTNKLGIYIKEADVLAGTDLFVKDGALMNKQQLIGKDGEQFWLQTSPVWVDTDYGPKTRPIPVVSDVSFNGFITIRPEQLNIYVEPTCGISAILDHFQFLQITRFFTSLSEFIDLLTNDQKHFTSGVSGPAPTVFIVAALERVKAYIHLTKGPLASPYDKCPAITENFSLLEINTEQNTRSNSPRSTPSIPMATSQPAIRRIEEPVEEFPDFSLALSSQDCDSVSVIDVADDTISMAASIEDLNYELDEEPMNIADQAEEAIDLDDVAINDRIYKSFMATDVNILTAELRNINAIVNVHDKHLKIVGCVNDVDLSYQLNITRQNAYEALKVKETPVKVTPKDIPRAKFVVSSPASTSTVFVDVDVNNVDVNLDDEVVSHLGAFAKDDQATQNNVRLNINVKDTAVKIRDRSKKNPMKLFIKECVIQQDEDSKSDEND